jgi:hypothetical protein
MKIRVDEDVEIRKRLEQDLQQSNQLRNLYNDLRRAHELLKVQSHQQVLFVLNFFLIFRLKFFKIDFANKRLSTIIK